ncbi:centromere protein K [Entomortierella parvispora]|uniref:Centromere protein K n=1 Tax=Entomortierella parvispora TaxID=205924 RepID=A0A9P3LTE6_9FUNG|nr:centromere protein K [Entomortierella parvispora]
MTPTSTPTSSSKSPSRTTPSLSQQSSASSSSHDQRREASLRETGEILRQRCLTKIEKLNELKDQIAKKQSKDQSGMKTGDPATEILKLEEARLRYDLNLVSSKTDPDVEPLPELTKIRVQRMVQDSIQDYAVMTPLIRKELEDTRKDLTAEKLLLKELNEINRALQTRRKELQQTIESGTSQESSQGRQKVQEMKKQVQGLMRELTGFLTEHHPPYQPDPDSPDVFELKHILEDIMNSSVSRPADPYIVLVPGEYYPPHVEQLINAGIAVRHPRDAQKLRLIDFYS